MIEWIPAPIHRALLPLAHKVRHHWRIWRGVPLRGCAAVIANLSGDILLLRHSYGPQVWSLPGGGVGAKEDPEKAIRRELYEELNLTLGKLEFIGQSEEVISGSHHTAFVFGGIAPGHPEPDHREVIEARFFPSHSLPEPLGRITRERITLWQQRGLRPHQSKES